MQQPYDRSTEDLGNAIHFEHVNVTIADQRLATLFYVAAFYHMMFETPAEMMNGDGPVARVKVGKDQYFLFRETDRPIPKYDGHHVAIYLANFSGPYRGLAERNLVTREDNEYQYRFGDT